VFMEGSDGGGKGAQDRWKDDTKDDMAKNWLGILSGMEDTIARILLWFALSRRL